MGEVAQITITEDNQAEVVQAAADEAARHDPTGTPTEGLEAVPDVTPEVTKEPTEEPKATEQSLSIKKEEAKEEEEVKADKAETPDDSEGLDLDPFYAEFAESGTLSEESQETIVSKLKAAGFKDAENLLAQHMQGSVASTEIQAARIAAVRSQAFEITGGEEQYGTMMQWAQENLSPAEVDAFDQAVSNPTLVPIAVRGLHAQYTAATGQQAEAPKVPAAARVEAVATSVIGVAPVTSLNQIAEITADPRFHSDASWRAQQEARIQASMDKGLV